MRRMAPGCKSKGDSALSKRSSDGDDTPLTGRESVLDEVAPLTPTANSGHKAFPSRKVSLLGVKDQQHAITASSNAEGSNALAGTTSDNDACFNMVNFILGAGVLGYPFCYKACGLVLTTILILICLIASQLSMRLLLVSSHTSGKRTYEDLAKHCFGKAGQRVMGTCVFMLNLGALIAYVNILADVLSSVAGSIIPPGAEPSRNMVMTGMTLCGALPVALLVKSPAVLALVSQASVSFVFLFSIVVAVMSLSPTQSNSPLLYWRPAGALVAFPVIAYGFTTHHFLFVVFASLKSPTVKRMTLVAQKAMFLCTLVYITVGACGYTAFKERTAGDVLRNFGARELTGVRGAYERLIKVGYGLSILGTVPLVVLPFQDSLGPLIAPWLKPLTKSSDKKQDLDGGAATADRLLLQEHLVTTAVLATALVAAIFLPNVEFIFGLAGSTASVLIAYIMPAAIFLITSSVVTQPVGTFSQGCVMTKSLCAVSPPGIPSEANAFRDGSQPKAVLGQKGFRRKAWGLLVFGLVVAVVCTRATLTAVQQEAAVVQLAQELAASEAAVVQAVKNEQKAKEVATAVDAVSEAARSIGAAQEDASAISGAALQAAAALSSLNGTNTSSLQPAGQNTGFSRQDIRQRREQDRKEAESQSLALGAVNHNLQGMKQRVNSTLVTFEGVTRALEAATAQLSKDQSLGEQKQLERQQHMQEQKRVDAVQSDAGVNVTVNGTATDHMDDFVARIDKLRQHSQQAASVWASARNSTLNDTLAASVSTTTTAANSNTSSSTAGDDETPEATKAARSVSILTAVYTQANATLGAIRQTAAALDAVEKAAEAVERAKGQHDNTGQAAASLALQEALVATKEAAQHVDETVSILQRVQAEQHTELVAVVSKLAKQEAAAEKEAAVAAARESTASDAPSVPASTNIAGNAAMALQQLDDIKGEGEPGSMNVSAVALAAVDIAATVVEAALLNVQRTVAKSLQQPEVGQRAGEIAKELGLRSHLDAADATQSNSTAAWRKFNFLSQNVSAFSNTSAFLSDDDLDDSQERQGALAALSVYQQLDGNNTDANSAALQQSVDDASPSEAPQLVAKSSAGAVESSRTQTRAERAGTRSGE